MTGSTVWGISASSMAMKSCCMARPFITTLADTQGDGATGRSARRAASRDGRTTEAPAASSSQSESMRHGLIQFHFVQAGQFPWSLLMHPVQHRPEFGWRVRRVWLRNRVRPKQALEFGREQCVIARALVPDAPQRQAVFGEGDVAHLPGDVTDATWRLAIPLSRRRLIDQEARWCSCGQRRSARWQVATWT
jgi:hypothetical protein